MLYYGAMFFSHNNFFVAFFLTMKINARDAYMMSARIYCAL